MIAPLLVFVAAYAYLRIFTPLAPDWWHDGYMLANALAIRDGAVPYRDIFQIYGMTTTWIHGTFQPSGGHTVLSLRNFSIALSALTAAAICLLPTLGFARWLGAATALAWVLLSDYAWSDDTWWVLPWSSVIATLIVLLLALTVSHTLLLSQGYLVRQSRPRMRPRLLLVSALAAFSGGLIAAAIFTRVVPGLLSLAATAALFFVLSAKPFRLALLISFLCGFASCVLAAVIYLQANNALLNAMQQILGYSPTFFGILSKFFRPSAFVSFLLVLVAVAITGTFLAAGYSLTLRRILIKTTQSLMVRPRQTAGFLTLFFVSAAFYYALARHSTFHLPLFASSVLRFIFWSVFLTVLLAILCSVVCFLRDLFFRTTNKNSIICGILGIYATISFSSIIPSISPRYVWWTMPIGLFLVFALLLGRINTMAYGIRPLSYMTVIGAIVVVILIATAYRARLPLKNNWSIGTGVFAGMYMPTKEKERYEDLVEFMNASVSPGSKLFFWCDNPVPSVANNRFVSASKFVAYSVPGNRQGEKIWTRGLAEDIKLNNGLVLLCADNPSKAAFEEHVGKLNFREVARAESGNFKLLELRRKSAVD